MLVHQATIGRTPLTSAVCEYRFGAHMNPYNKIAYIPPRLQQPPKSPQTTHPTSTPRTAPWPIFVPVWHNGLVPQSLPSITYIPPMPQPSPHYRPHTNTYPPFPPPRPPDNAVVHEPLDQSECPLVQHPSETTSPDSNPVVKVINNEIPTGGLSPQKALTADDVVAVLEAALRQAACQSRGGSEVDGNGNDRENRFSSIDSIGAGPLDHQMEEELMEFCVLGDYGSERIMTEDGDTNEFRYLRLSACVDES